MDNQQENQTYEIIENSSCHCHECDCGECHCHDNNEEQDTRRISYYEPSPDDFDDWD